MNKWQFALVGLLAGGCVSTSPIQIKGPSGRSGYALHCSGAGHSIERCYQQAGELCSTGYDVVDNPSGTQAAAIGGRFIAGQKRSLIVECK